MSEDQRLRVAIVGCGMAALVQYVPALRYGKRGLVTALCDPNPRAMDLIGRYFPDAERFESYEQMLREARVDGVLLVTPPRLHREQAKLAARAGKHVLCEKPMAPTVEDCDAIIEGCADAGVTLMIGFMKRFDKSMRYVKTAIDDGSLGSVFRSVLSWQGQVTPHGTGRSELEAAIQGGAVAWRGSLASGGGAFADLGAHTIDLARWWLGEIESVSGTFAIVREGSQVDDSASAIFRHAGGGSSTHLVGWTNKRWQENYQIDGADASLGLDFGPGASHASVDAFRMTRYTEGGRTMTDETLYGDWSIDLELARFGRYVAQVDHFCECALEGREPLATGADGRKAAEAVNALYLSAYLGETVRLPLESSVDLEEIFTAAAKRRPGSRS